MKVVGVAHFERVIKWMLTAPLGSQPDWILTFFVVGRRQQSMKISLFCRFFFKEENEKFFL